MRGEYGHLEVLKWAREKDCPWDWRTCAYAAKGGHLEVLKWLRANDCPGTVNPPGFTLPFGFTFGFTFWVYLLTPNPPGFTVRV